jgi:hypothetical protein
MEPTTNPTHSNLPLTGPAGADPHAPRYSYKRHEPENTLLYRVMAERLEPWLADRQADESRSSLPKFVVKTLRGFLDCGILARGFVLLACDECHEKTPGAFSCKLRGLCPSYGSKRMWELSIHLTENVLPHVPYR